MTSQNSRHQTGFSLLELLVAFAILAMSLGLIYKAMGASARQVGDMSIYQQASMLAESLLASRDSVTDQGWSESGEQNPFTWQISSQPYTSEVNAPDMVPLHSQHGHFWSDGPRRSKLKSNFVT